MLGGDGMNYSYKNDLDLMFFNNGYIYNEAKVSTKEKIEIAKHIHSLFLFPPFVGRVGVGLLPPISLCGQARCAYTQEAEIPIQQVKQHGANSNTAYRRGIGYMPHDGGIYQPYQRYRDVGKNARHCQAKYLSVDAHFLLTATLFDHCVVRPLRCLTASLFERYAVRPLTLKD